MKMTLNKFLQNGIKLKIFEVKRICDIEKSPTSTAQTEVIDFDRTKDIILESINKGQVKFLTSKSCDALKVLADQKIIDFIEFKGFKKFIQYEKIKSGSDERIGEKVRSFNLQTKIMDSFMLFSQILRINKMDLSNDEISELLNTAKSYYIMVDIDVDEEPDKSLAITLEYLSDPLAGKSSEAINVAIGEQLTEVLAGIDLTLFNISVKGLISADRIDAHYNKIMEVV